MSESDARIGYVTITGYKQMVTRSDIDNIHFARTLNRDNQTTAAVVAPNQEASPINLIYHNLHLSSSHLLPTARSKEPKDIFLESVGRLKQSARYI